MWKQGLQLICLVTSHDCHTAASRSNIPPELHAQTSASDPEMNTSDFFKLSRNMLTPWLVFNSFHFYLKTNEMISFSFLVSFHFFPLWNCGHYVTRHSTIYYGQYKNNLSQIFKDLYISSEQICRSLKFYIQILILRLQYHSANVKTSPPNESELISCNFCNTSLKQANVLYCCFFEC